MKKFICPSCKRIFCLEVEIKVQERISCPNCTALLEVVNLFPPILDWAEDPAVNRSSRRIFTKLY